MKYMIFSDVHGNLIALEAVLKDAGFVDGYISLGDVVNYGPWSNECVERIGELHNCVCLMGNHERAFLSGTSPGESELVASFYFHCKKNFTHQNMIKSYKLDHRIKSYICQHTVQNRYIFPNTHIDLDKNYFVGHSHYQFKIENNDYCLYNPGSVGQNRLNLANAQYLIFDTASDSVDLRTCTYNAHLVIDKMRQDNFPDSCIEYYQSKMRSV